MKPDAHDAATKAGMEAFMSSNEETFEDFLSSFINPVDSHVLSQLNSARQRFNTDRPNSSGESNDIHPSVTVSQSENHSVNEEHKAEDEIEEVTLHNENRSGGICASRSQKRPTFDNFVLLESDVDDDEEIEEPCPSSYFPTVADSPKSVKTFEYDQTRIADTEDQSHPNGACASTTDVKNHADMSRIVSDTCGIVTLSHIECDPSFVQDKAEEGRANRTTDFHDLSPVTHFTMLDASLAPSISNAPTVSRLPSSDVPDNEANEMVQPFSLDEDFDYDNVNLSVKYTTEELRAVME